MKLIIDPTKLSKTQIKYLNQVIQDWNIPSITVNEENLAYKETEGFGVNVWNCDECQKQMPKYTLPHYTIDKKLCVDCFTKELTKIEEQRIKDHPCPFKYEGAKITYPANVGGRPVVDGVEIQCDIRAPRPCIGEKNCPIYNRGK